MTPDLTDGAQCVAIDEMPSLELKHQHLLSLQTKPRTVGLG